MSARVTVAGVMGVVVALAALALPTARAMDEEMAELAKMLRDNCIGETGADVALIEAVNAGADLPPDPKLKCYVKCVMETAGMFSDGVVDLEAVLALLPDDFRARNEGNLRKCGTQKGADDCDTAFKTQACWQKANKKEYFLI